MSETVRPTCTGCGRQPSGDDVPWTWSVGEDGVLCETCIRDHARSVESKLDPRWW
ncbi:MAG TPA: hypothetical protein VIT20_11625 [Propionibacteriaceae bacterium]